MSSIVTFYSYKGGVGRTMTLANIAVLLAQRGFCTLAIDWDLEAPGLEQYFDYFESQTSPAGLLSYLTEVGANLEAGTEPPDFSNYLWTVDVQGKMPLQLLPSGRTASPESYAANLEAFEWQHFFESGGGHFLEQLRNQWLADYDIVLIDSRTGLSDTGGICTIFLPDVLVAMFTPNHQSLYGIRSVIEMAQRGRQKLAYDRMPLNVLPILARFASTAEFRLSQEWLDRSAEVFGSILGDWIPQWIEPRKVFERLRIPQVDYFSFGERLAVVEESATELSSIAYVMERLSDLLASDFRDLEGALGSIARRPEGWQEVKFRVLSEGAKRLEQSSPSQWHYDIYVSYSYQSSALTRWIDVFIDSLSAYLALELPAPPRIFLDRERLDPNSVFSEALSETMSRSKLLLAFLTPSYFASEWCHREWDTFERREQKIAPKLRRSSFVHSSENHSLIKPVLLRGQKSRPEKLLRHMPWDASQHVNLSDPEAAIRHPEMARLIQELATQIARTLEAIPDSDSM